MNSESSQAILRDEVIINQVYDFRGEQVMIDRDLALLYGVETKQLKRQVRRNIKRFPTDFMFELTKEEFDSLRSQNGTSKEKGGVRYLPMAFTEQGVSMLTSVLNSERAIGVNIQIMRVFTKMRKMLMTHQDLLLQGKDVLLELEQIKKHLFEHDDSIDMVMKYLKQFVQDQKTPRKEVGFKSNNKGK